MEDCSAIITETHFSANWIKIEGYHELGKRILEEKNYGDKIVPRLAESLNFSERTLYRATAFAKKFPDLQKLPEGKNVTWNKIITQYLPESKQEKKRREVICPHCNEKFEL